METKYLSSFYFFRPDTSLFALEKLHIAFIYFKNRSS